MKSTRPADPPPELDLARLPRHVAIIMDGNGRWARARGLPREAGHRAGVRTVHTVVETCARLGIDVLTLYAFSAENWIRPDREVSAIMGLLYEQLTRQLAKLLANDIRLAMIGRRAGLPARVLDRLDSVCQRTRDNSRMTLNLALNYGGRQEILEAVRALAEQVAAGARTPASIDEAAFAAQLDTAGQPDPDLLIRTSGEQRISNFLLWQIAYAEFFITPVLWPDFDDAELYRALIAYQSRSRRFGGTGGEDDA